MARKSFCTGLLIRLIAPALIFSASAPAQDNATNLIQPNGETAAIQADSSRREERNAAASFQAEPKSRSLRLDVDYYAGTAAQNRGHLTQALFLYERIIETDRNFRDVRRRVAQIERSLKRENLESISARYYADAMLAIERNDLGWAQRALEKLNRLNPGYQDILDLIVEIEAKLQATPETVRLKGSPPMTTILFDSLYQAGLNAATQHDWMQAVINFEKLQLIQPNYPALNDRLAESRTNFKATQPTGLNDAVRNSMTKALYLTGGFAAFLLLSVAGFMGFSPASRARFQLWRGNGKAAAQIYEKLLRQQPHKVKLYLPLSKIYLRLGRNDEPAMKAYKTVLNLNLATQQRDEINAIVAQKYLAEGRMDTDAIEVLESALKSELHKQNRLLPQAV